MEGINFQAAIFSKFRSGKKYKKMGNNVHETVANYIRTWEKRCYKYGIPDEAPFSIKDKVPNYKSICMCLLKNDHYLTELGFTAKPSKYYGILKRIELSARGNIQLKLF